MELNLSTIERIERYIVFDEAVTLQHWEDTSSHGFKIRLGLQERAHLDPFDKTMKRRKHRGGQRYHAILTAADDLVQMEAMFCGRGWSESSGAHIALHVPHLKDQIWIRQQKTFDQEGECSTWNVILMEIGDDEVIIDQTAQVRAERLIGGPHSKAVAMLLQDADFIHWLDFKSIHGITDSPRSNNDRDLKVKAVCGIKSKVEFDHNEETWQRWEAQFHRPFIRYMQRRHAPGS